MDTITLIKKEIESALNHMDFLLDEEIKEAMDAVNASNNKEELVKLLEELYKVESEAFQLLIKDVDAVKQYVES